MSEFFIVGKPRGGKSYLGVKYIYETLLASKGAVLRPIVTNIRLNLPAIAASLKADLKLEYTPDLASRVRILDDAETGEFWLYTVGREFMERKEIKMRKWQFNVPDFKDRGDQGCLYVIDEIHVFFPAVMSLGKGKEEMQLEDDVRFFLTQHGKMNIDIICITQHPEQVSKMFRRLAQEYMHVRNLSREPIFGFRIGNLFRYSRSLNSPGSLNPCVFDSGFHTMDFKKYGAMYDTTQGVGIAGSIIHEPEKRGRHLGWLIPGVAVLVWVLWWFGCRAPAHVMQASQSMADKFAKSHNLTPFKTHPGGALGALGLSPLSDPVSGQGEGIAAKAAGYVEFAGAGSNVVVTGWQLLPGRCVVFLSDGRTADSRFGEVQELQRTFALCFGGKYRVATTKDLVPAVQETVNVGQNMSNDSMAGRGDNRVTVKRVRLIEHEETNSNSRL
jgi:hypothetical protein